MSTHNQSNQLNQSNHGVKHTHSFITDITDLQLISAASNFTITLPPLSYGFDEVLANGNLGVVAHLISKQLLKKHALAHTLALTVAQQQRIETFDFKKNQQLLLLTPTALLCVIDVASHEIHEIHEINTANAIAHDDGVSNPFKRHLKSDVGAYAAGLTALKSLLKQSEITGIEVHLADVAHAPNTVTELVKAWSSMNYCLFTRYPQLKKQVHALTSKSESESESLTASMHFNLHLNSKSVKNTVEQLVKAAFNKGVAVAKGITLTKDLSNLPANICTPNFMVSCAQQLASSYGLTLTVLDAPALIAANMRTFLSVAQGGNAEPKMIVLSNQQPGVSDASAPIALIGKGITFDTGGISLKPAEGMDDMKSDMAGAASILGAVLASMEQGFNQPFVAILPCCENMPSATATRPGDVVESLNGLTIEILNTDAEGRLILCDALTYAQQQFKPKVMIDVATLTGACVVALGHVHAGLYSNQTALSQALVQAGDLSLDTAWPMPLDQAYHELLKSPFADVANIGGRWGGSITAACFLQKFIENDTPWAHLDIAGVARGNAKEKNASGRPVSLLVEWLFNQ